MAAILLGYFGTMVTVFAGIMYFLASILDTGSAHHLRAHPYRMSVAARAMVAERLAAQRTAANIPTGTVATAAPTPAPGTVAVNTPPAESSSPRNAERQVLKTRQLKLAREVKRQERRQETRQETRQVHLASRSLDRGYAALGYASESPTRVAADRIFNSINPRR